jgi:NAD(P)-dependent dehydrogenase (short-subunit alcohol dehydrogenase family)
MLPLLRKSAGGYLGNVSSGLGTVAFLADPDETFRDYVTLLAYNSSKAALNAVTLIYANALRDSGIRVNALSPGYCATDMNGNAGTSTAAEGGAAIAREVLDASGDSGVFLSEQGGTYPW